MYLIGRSISLRFPQLILVAIVFSIFYIIEVNADILNVREVSQSGTIQYAIDMAKEGDTIFLPEGKYKEQVKINKSLVIKGEGLHKTRWNLVRQEKKVADKNKDEESSSSIWDFIKHDKKEGESEHPCGIKIIGDSISLTIEHMQLHCIKDLNAVDLDNNLDVSVSINIKNCLLTSDENSLPYILAKNAAVTISDSVFRDIKSTGINLEDKCNLSIRNVNFTGGGGNRASIYLEKSIGVVRDSVFTDIKSMCVTVVGSNSSLGLKGCRFVNSGSGKSPSVYVKDNAKAVISDCTFKNGNGSFIIIENKSRLKLKGKNEFYGKSDLKEPLLRIVDSEVTTGGTDSGSISIFNNIGVKGILVQDGKLFANNCQFQGDGKTSTFIECEKGSLKIQKSNFGANKECIVINECESIHLESCDFGRSESYAIQIKKVNGSNNSLLLECTFASSNGSSVKVEGKSNMFVRLCTFKGGSKKNPTVYVDDSQVTFVRCFFKSINSVGIKGTKESNIFVKGCEFSNKTDGNDFAIYIDDRSKAEIANCSFNWNNNKLFYAKDCAEVKFSDISPEYKKLRE